MYAAVQSITKVAFLAILPMAVTVNARCYSLGETFDLPFLELPTTVELIGDEKTAGYLDVFSGNPLLIEGYNGTKVAEDFGQCTLLPNLEYSYCSGAFIFDDDKEDTISWAGLVSHSQDVTSILAITGGTGCYDGSKGTLAATPQFLDETESMGILWEYLPEPRPSQCIPLSGRFNEKPLYQQEQVSTRTMIGNNETLGSLNLWSGNPLLAGTMDGDRVGDSHGVCTLVSDTNAYNCDGLIRFDNSNDTVTFSFISQVPFESGIVSITGGTGCYGGARLGGVMELTPQPNNFYRVDYGVRTPDPSCKSLPEIFNDSPLIEDNANGVTVGSLDSAGTQTFWYNHLLSVGEIGGDEKGQTTGACTLLAGATYWRCSGELDFGDMGAVAFQGISPNSFDTGVFSITGGNGCFSTIGGTLHDTGLQINSPFDAWKWELISAEQSSDIFPINPSDNGGGNYNGAYPNGGGNGDNANSGAASYFGSICSLALMSFLVLVVGL